jgi:hypothetical protein
MVDVREDILARLLEVIATIPNIRSAHRNNTDIDETQLPAAIVLDGDEDTDDAKDLSMRPSNRPTVVQMTPEIMICHQDPNVGTELGVFRRELIKRVLNDTELIELAKTARLGNGAIRYLGCQFGTAWLRQLHGAVKAQFLFKYTLRPDDL